MGIQRLSPFRKLKSFDIFAIVNIALFIVITAVVYYDRFVEYRGPANLHEFYIYAIAIILFVCLCWWYFRRFFAPVYILVLIQIAVLLHFGGAFIPVDGNRLYDAVIFGIGYDKYVHFINSFIVAATLNEIFHALHVRIPVFRNIVIVLMTLGVGAIVEILEYMVVLTIPDTGVGDYHNNMRDLVANLFGSLMFLMFMQTTFFQTNRHKKLID
ncbi:MAG: hypothetical protein EA359_05775 [Balneolaceae bacterium]|nr:MAG: hypothetical protein EA359_05775 [Balneolaceae bacterium]